MQTNLYRDIARRTGSNIYIGVVGPVRTGKSTFIKRFMEAIVIPNIEDIYLKERAKDELPQSGSGRTIMTAEPKFIPEDAVPIQLEGDVNLSVRLIDCVGYMVSGASGRFENGEERMVSTPWFDHEISMTEAAETGTHKVIADHSTMGLVITTDGSLCGIPREDYVEAETRVIRELKSIGKPFIILVNSADPTSHDAKSLVLQLAQEHGVTTLCVNCLELEKEDITTILQSVLMEFPINHIGFNLPAWMEMLPYDTPLLQEILEYIRESFQHVHYIKDIYSAMDALTLCETVKTAIISQVDMGTGEVLAEIDLPRELYYETISQQSGFIIENDGQLLKLLTEMRDVKSDYEQIQGALQSVRETGYGIVQPRVEDLQLHEPEIVRQGGKYSVKLKANAPAIHMIMTNIETTVTPTIGGETASEEIINLLLQGLNGDFSRIWESNIFGKSLYDIAGEGVTAKIAGMSPKARAKFQETLQRVINEGAGGLICIIL